MDAPLFLIVASFLLGLIIGSFLNVVAIRIIHKQSIAYPPSHCVHCQTPLKPWELIPLFSYVFLRGTCSHCKQAISPVYPLGELATGLLFALWAWQIGWNKELLIFLIISSIFVVIVHTDVKKQIIPNAVVYFGFITIGLLRLWSHPLPLWQYAAGFLAAGLLLYMLAVVSKGGMGGGDIKLFALIGLVQGLYLTLFTLFLASLFGVLYGLIMMRQGKREQGTFIAFGPFIALGFIVSALWGPDFIHFLLHIPL